MFKRFIIVSQKEGVFLGSCMGMCFWSNLDSVGQDEAVSFDSRRTAEEIIKENPGAFPMKDINIREVETQDDTYATIAECVAVGVSPWEVVR